MLAMMISHASRSVGVRARRVLSVWKKAPTIFTHSRR